MVHTHTRARTRMHVHTPYNFVYQKAKILLHTIEWISCIIITYNLAF